MKITANLIRSIQNPNCFSFSTTKIRIITVDTPYMYIKFRRLRLITWGNEYRYLWRKMMKMIL